MDTNKHEFRARKERAGSVRRQILARDVNGLITACRLEKPVFAPYGRLEVADPAGRRAWTNPLWTA